MMAVNIKTERQLMQEFLELYRDSPCLWSPQHPLYNNREAREQALEVLLEKYSPLHDNANLDTVRKKIDSLRCCYKRERKKALTIEAEGGVHITSLWYYKLMTFLDTPDIYDETTDLNNTGTKRGSQELEDCYEFVKFEEEFQPETSFAAPKRKKRIKTEVAEHLYIPDADVQEDIDGNLVTQSQPDNLKIESTEHEAVLFGKTIGLQLQQLEPMQRFIAEKLISEVIFYGRLDKLNTQTNVSLK